MYRKIFLLVLISIPTSFIISNNLGNAGIRKQNSVSPATYKKEVKSDSVSLAEKSSSKIDEEASIQELYKEMNLENLMDSDAFTRAVKGYHKLNKNNKELITLIDFSRPSTEKRLYVIDMQNKKIIYSSYVSHGKNSGENFATSFSNREGSYQSSLGFYMTENTYIGKNGFSLVLNGLEKGFNDLAKKRAVVIHGADYANPEVIKSTGRLGRSFGCPALPHALNKEIINTIKGGSLLFIYAKDKKYLENSNIL